MLNNKMVAELVALTKKGHGELKTEAVVELAKKPTSALHGHPAFIWDLKKAAHAQWMEAARSIVQVFIRIIDDDGEKKSMRQYVHVVTEANGPVYRETATVLLENRATIVNIVCDRILSAIQGYPLHEFDEVIQLVNTIRQGETSLAHK